VRRPHRLEGRAPALKREDGKEKIERHQRQEHEAPQPVLTILDGSPRRTTYDTVHTDQLNELLDFGAYCDDILDLAA